MIWVGHQYSALRTRQRSRYQPDFGNGFGCARNAVAVAGRPESGGRRIPDSHDFMHRLRRGNPVAARSDGARGTANEHKSGAGTRQASARCAGIVAGRVSASGRDGGQVSDVKCAETVKCRTNFLNQFRFSPNNIPNQGRCSYTQYCRLESSSRSAPKAKPTLNSRAS